MSLSYRRFSCYHSKLFVLRLTVNLYGQPLLPTVSPDGQIELCIEPTANHHIELHLSMTPVARNVQLCLRHFGYGVVDRVMYGDGAPLFQIDTVQNFNRDSLNALMKILPLVEIKLESAFKALVAHSKEVEMDLEVTTQLCLICPDTTNEDACILDVCDENVAEYFEWWQKSIISQFHHSPQKIMPKMNKNASASAKVHMEKLSLPELITELQTVVDWMMFGLGLNMDYNKLAEIKKDHNEVGPCKIKMLHVWMQLKPGSWADIVQALQFINMKALAKDIAERHGVPFIPRPTTNRRRTLTEIIAKNGNQLPPGDMLVLKKLDDAARREEELLAKNDTQIQHLKQHLRRGSGKVKNMTVKLDKLKSEIEAKEREKAELEQIIEEMEHKMEDLRNSEILLKESLEEATQKQKDMQRTISAKEKELADTKQKLEEKEKELQQQRMEKERLDWRLEQANKEVTEKTDKIEQLEGEERTNFEDFKNTLSKLEKVLENVTPDDVLSKKGLSQCQRQNEELDEYKEKLAEKEQKISELSQQITKLQHEIFTLQTMRSDIDHGTTCDGATATSISEKFTRSLDRLGKRARNKALRRHSLIGSAMKTCESSTLSKEEEAAPLIPPPNLSREESIQPEIDHELVTQIIQKHWTHEILSPHNSSDGQDTPTPDTKEEPPRPTSILERRHNRKKQGEAATPEEIPSFEMVPTKFDHSLNDSCRSGILTPLPIPLQLPLQSSHIHRSQPIAAWRKLTRMLSKASRFSNWHKSKNYHENNLNM